MPRQVTELSGGAAAKKRLRWILEAATGRRTIAEACAALGIGRSRFHALRRRALEGALAGLAPGVPGRRCVRSAEHDRGRVELEQRVRELEADLEVALVRTELALALPEVVQRGWAVLGKKTTSRPARRKAA